MFLKTHLFVICYEMYKGHILSKLGHFLNKTTIIPHVLMVTVFHFHFCHFRVTVIRDHTNILVAQRSNPIQF